jgi:hypothetical protein
MDFKDLLNPKPRRWPKKGDRPFRNAKDLEIAAPLPDERVMREVLMIEGFMCAGAALVDQATTERFRQNDLVYPAIYCYRHAIELWLKWLVTLYGPSAGVRLDDLDHDLWALWGRFRQVCVACGDRTNKEGVDAVEQIVKDFHDWDKEGNKFRYASPKKGGGAHKFPLPDIDFMNLRDVMTGVDNFFNGSDGWLSDAVLERNPFRLCRGLGDRRGHTRRP